MFFYQHRQHLSTPIIQHFLEPGLINSFLGGCCDWHFTWWECLGLAQFFIAFIQARCFNKVLVLSLIRKHKPPSFNSVILRIHLNLVIKNIREKIVLYFMIYLKLYQIFIFFVFFNYYLIKRNNKPSL